MTRRNVPRYRRPRALFTAQVPKESRKPKMRWKILPIIWLAVKRAATVIGFMVLVSTLIAVVSVSTIPSRAVPVQLPGEMILAIEFKDGFFDKSPPPTLSDPFAQQELTVRDYVEAIEAAAADTRVKGILARLEPGSYALAHIQEIRAALAEFKQSGKFAHVYAPSLGGPGGGLGQYYLASAFDEIWMQPLGVVSIPGLLAEVPYAADALAAIGVSPQFFQREDYKTAYESLTRQSMSPENREMLTALLDEIRSVLVADIATDRGMSESDLTRLVNEGLFPAEAAQNAGLIDHADYADVLLDKVLVDVTGKGFDEWDREDIPLVTPRRYLADVQRRGIERPEQTREEPPIKMTPPVLSGASKPKLALVHVVGAIMREDVSGAGLSQVYTGGIAASERIVPAIYDAMDDPQVTAIVVRVDSPGGSPEASESILRALNKAKEKGKTVIVSMGPVAASGGYWVATHAHEIFTHPTTITGSIGVVGGKFALQGMMDKLQINWDRVEWGRNAGLWSPVTPFSESEAARINTMLDAVYDAFLTRVAEGRDMPRAEVERIAGGRVYTGARAVELGLADRFGGLTDALDRAAELSGAVNRHAATVELYPKPKTALEQFIELLERNAGAVEVLSRHTPLIESAEPVLNSWHRARYADELSVLDAPPLR